jgi:hypothetical protein
LGAELVVPVERLFLLWSLLGGSTIGGLIHCSTKSIANPLSFSSVAAVLALSMEKKFPVQVRGAPAAAPQIRPCSYPG